LDLFNSEQIYKLLQM